MKEEDKVINTIFEPLIKKADLISDFFDAVAIREELKFFIKMALEKQKKEIIKKIEEIEECNEPYCERDDFLLKRIKYRVIKII